MNLNSVCAFLLARRSYNTNRVTSLTINIDEVASLTININTLKLKGQQECFFLCEIIQETLFLPSCLLPVANIINMDSN